MHLYWNTHHNATIYLYSTDNSLPIICIHSKSKSTDDDNVMLHYFLIADNVCIQSFSCTQLTHLFVILQHIVQPVTLLNQHAFIQKQNDMKTANGICYNTAIKYDTKLWNATLLWTLKHEELHLIAGVISLITLT